MLHFIVQILITISVVLGCLAVPAFFLFDGEGVAEGLAVLGFFSFVAAAPLMVLYMVWT